MRNLTYFPGRPTVSAAAEKQLAKNGWHIKSIMSENQDYVISCGNMRFPVLCLHQAITDFFALELIIESIILKSRWFRSRSNRMLVVVLSNDFLDTQLNKFSEGDIFITTLSQLDEVCHLSRFSDRVPENITERQDFLLKRDVDYALFVSKLYQKENESKKALEWGEAAVRYTMGVTAAHYNLFSIYNQNKMFSELDDLSKKMAPYLQGESRFIKLMAQSFKERGNIQLADHWEEKLSGASIKPTTFQDILDKQKMTRENKYNVETSKHLRDNRTKKTSNGIFSAIIKSLQK